MDRICKLLEYINGSLNDESDDLIGDSELYHMYTDMLACDGGVVTDKDMVKEASEKATENYVEPIPGARKRLMKILQVMAYAHYVSIARKSAEEILSQLQ